MRAVVDFLEHYWLQHRPAAEDKPPLTMPERIAIRRRGRDRA